MVVDVEDYIIGECFPVAACPVKYILAKFFNICQCLFLWYDIVCQVVEQVSHSPFDVLCGINSLTAIDFHESQLFLSFFGEEILHEFLSNFSV